MDHRLRPIEDPEPQSENSVYPDPDATNGGCPTSVCLWQPPFCDGGSEKRGHFGAVGAEVAGSLLE